MAQGFSETQLVAGIVIVTTLAIVGGQARFLRVRRALGLEQLLSSGFLFVPLGMLLSEAGFGIVNRDVARSLSPLLTLGLGVLGLLAGLRVDAREVDERGRRLLGASASVTLVTLLLVGVPIFFLLEPLASGASATQRGAAAALIACVAAVSGARPLHAALGEHGPAAAPVTRLADAGNVGAVIAAGVLAALLLPSVLQPLQHLLALFAIGVAGGLCLWLFGHEARDPALRTALHVGVVLLTAGTAAHLSLPPVAATLIAGITVANLPGTHARGLEGAIAFLEPPLTVLLLVIAGASMPVPNGLALVVLVVFLLLRTSSKIVGGRLASRLAPDELPAQVGLGLLPSGAVALGLALDHGLAARNAFGESVVVVAVLGTLLSETAGVWSTRLLARALVPAPPPDAAEEAAP